MAIESKPDIRGNPNPILPVWVGDIPQGTRLAIALFDLDRIEKVTTQQRSLRTRNRKVIGEAIHYVPPFAAEIASSLVDTERILLESGFVPAQPNKPDIDDRIDGELVDTSYRSSQTKDQTTSGATDIARKIIKVFHPDTAEEAAQAVASKEEQTQILKQALKAADKQDAGAAEDVYLESMPQYLLRKMQGMLDKGMTFEDIVNANPELVSEIELLRYIALKRLPKRFEYRKFQKPEDAEWKAKEMKWRDDRNARTIGIGMVYASLSAVVDYCAVSNFSPAIVTQAKGLMEGLQHAGGYVGGADNFMQDNGFPLYYGDLNREQDTIRLLPDLLSKLAIAVMSRNTDAINLAAKEFQKATTSVLIAAKNFCESLVRFKSLPKIKEIIKKPSYLDYKDIYNNREKNY